MLARYNIDDIAFTCKRIAFFVPAARKYCERHSIFCTDIAALRTRDVSNDIQIENSNGNMNPIIIGETEGNRMNNFDSEFLQSQNIVLSQL